MSRNKLIMYMLLLVPVVSSVLSTVHIISLTSLGNPLVMAIATAVTYEISSIVSFISSSTSSVNISKGRLYFIFVILFILQCVGNTYSGFHYINGEISSNSSYLSDIMEMTFNILNPAELKLALSALIGIPLPLISLIMLRSALEFAEGISKNNAAPVEEHVSAENVQSPIASVDVVDEVGAESAAETIENKEDVIESEHVNAEKTDVISVSKSQQQPSSKKITVKPSINKKEGSIDRDPGNKNIVMR